MKNVIVNFSRVLVAGAMLAAGVTVAMAVPVHSDCFEKCTSLGNPQSSCERKCKADNL